MLNNPVFRDAQVLLSMLANETMPFWLFEGRVEGMLQDHGKKPEITERRPRYRVGSECRIFDGVSNTSIEAIPIS